MITVYETLDGAWTGKSKSISEDGSWSPNWTTAEPPTPGEGETPVWNGTSWSLVSEWPTPAMKEEALKARAAGLKATLQTEYAKRLGADVLFDFTGAASITDFSGAAPPSPVLAMQMSKEDQDNWRTKWSEAISSAPDDVLVIVCENRWYVTASPALLITAFKHATQAKQVLLAMRLTLERLIDLADTDAALDTVEQAISNPTWGIA